MATLNFRKLVAPPLVPESRCQNIYRPQNAQRIQDIAYLTNCQPLTNRVAVQLYRFVLSHLTTTKLSPVEDSAVLIASLVVAAKEIELHPPCNETIKDICQALSPKCRWQEVDRWVKEIIWLCMVHKFEWKKAQMVNLYLERRRLRALQVIRNEDEMMVFDQLIDDAVLHSAGAVPRVPALIVAALVMVAKSRSCPSTEAAH